MPSANYHTLEIAGAPSGGERKREKLANGVILNLIPESGDVASVWFPAGDFTLEQARAWAKDNDYAGEMMEATGEAMSDARERVVLFATAQAEKAWHTILTVGEKRGTPMAGPGHVKFTAGDLDELVAAFERERPVDVNHATGAGAVDPSSTAARGWIKALRRAGDALEALIEWTDEGAEFIKSGAFRYFSIELGRRIDQKTGKPSGRQVIGGTLTNHPFWDLPALALSADVADAITGIKNDQAEDPPRMGRRVDTSAEHKEDPMPDLILRLSEVAGREGLTEDDAVEMLSDLKQRAETADALTKERDDLRGEVDALKAKETEANSEITALSERLGTMEASLTAERERAALEADLSRNALSTAEAGTKDDPGPARKLWRRDVELYAEVYGQRPDNFATTGGGDNGTTATTPKPKDDAPDYSGITTQADAEDLIVNLATRYQEDHADVAYTDAEARIFRNINEQTAGEGDRLRTLMMEV